MHLPHPDLKFGSFTLKTEKRTLSQNGEVIKIRDREFDLLVFLIRTRAPEVCSYDEIIESVWKGVAVENNSVEKAVANLRLALSDMARDPTYIRTVRARGYLFIGNLEAFRREDLADDPGPEAGRTYSWFMRIAGIGGGVLLLFIVMWFAPHIWHRWTTKILFADSFSGAIDGNKWTALGDSVIAEQGVAKVQCLTTDNCGRLISNFFAVDPAQPVTVKCRIRVHFDRHVKDKIYFLGLFGLTFKRPGIDDILVGDNTLLRDVSINGIYYANYDASTFYPNGEIDEFPVEGWFLFRNGASPNKKVEYRDGQVSSRIDPKWDQWIEQTLVWQPNTGKVSCLIDGKPAGDFNFGPLPDDLVDNNIRIEVAPRGWWLYHSIELDYVEVSQ